jgi:hypothetical protein
MRRTQRQDALVRVSDVVVATRGCCVERSAHRQAVEGAAHLAGQLCKGTDRFIVRLRGDGTLAQLTSATNAGGQTGAAGPSYPLGPYVAGGRFPVNPFDQQNAVSATAVFPPTASTSAGGWFYHQATGQIAANTDGHLTD